MKYMCKHIWRYASQETQLEQYENSKALVSETQNNMQYVL